MAASPKKKNNAKPARRTVYREKHIVSFLFAVGGVLTVFLGMLLFALDQLHIPDIRTVSHYQPKQATLIVDRYGSIVERIYTENRIVVGLDRMAPLLPKAFVAAEDSRFYEHPGLDFVSVLRALINNLKNGGKRQGGSTITQQVAKGLLLTPEKTYLRKFKEAILAWRIDTLLSKDEIIYIYLNHIYLGAGAYGVEAAAQTYFGKRAAALTLSESALLAGLPQAPSTYSPFDHWQQARARQRYVLNRMAADGYITEQQALIAYKLPPALRERDTEAERSMGYYVQEVRKRAAHMLDRPLDEAGVVIHTNLDQTLQQSGREAVVAGVRAIVSRSGAAAGTQRTPEGALVCLDACSGAVRALVGGTDFTTTPFNRAAQARRPAGSIFKPLIYSAALEHGFRPQSTVRDEPLTVTGRDGKLWQPKNFSNTYHGTVTLHEALVHSYNIPAIKVMQRIGVQDVHDLARALGISATLPADLSLALGAVDLSLLEITAAYLPFVCDGRWSQPRLIERITNHDGIEVYRAAPHSSQVLSEQTALRMRTMLEAVIRDGTGRTAAGLAGRNGGKTGTSDENRDAWFVGFHGGRLGGVWFGYDHNESLGPRENGGTTAAPPWRDFMKRADAVGEQR